MPEMTDKSLESWIWDAACSIRGAKDAPKYKEFILPLIFAKRLGLNDVEPDIIGRSYEYLIRKFAEGSVSSAGDNQCQFRIKRIAGCGFEVDRDESGGNASICSRCAWNAATQY